MNFGVKKMERGREAPDKASAGILKKKEIGLNVERIGQTRSSAKVMLITRYQALHLYAKCFEHTLMRVNIRIIRMGFFQMFQWS